MRDSNRIPHGAQHILLLFACTIHTICMQSPNEWGSFVSAQSTFVFVQQYNSQNAGASAIAGEQIK